MKRQILILILLFTTTFVSSQDLGVSKFKTSLKNIETKKSEFKIPKGDTMQIESEEGIYFRINYKDSFYLIVKDNVRILNKDHATINLPIDGENNKITYSEVVRLGDSIASNELYSRGREWFAKTYNSSQSVLQMEDEVNGKLIGKALFPVYHKALGRTFDSGDINYTISLYFKNGRYKYEITDFIHTSNYESGSYKKTCDEMRYETRKVPKRVYDYYFVQLDKNMKNLIDDLKVSMDKSTYVKPNDDW